MKEQAREYLMTYGWTILIILIVTGVLTYYGLFRIKNFSVKEIDFKENPAFYNITKCFKLDNLTVKCQKSECFKLSYNNTFCKFLEDAFYNIED